MVMCEMLPLESCHRILILHGLCSQCPHHKDCWVGQEAGPGSRGSLAEQVRNGLRSHLIHVSGMAMLSL